ncbi:hypothetical protein ACP4OV_014401 [Aristida adscensionis]
MGCHVLLIQRAGRAMRNDPAYPLGAHVSAVAEEVLMVKLQRTKEGLGR